MQSGQRRGRWDPNDLDQRTQWGILARLVDYGWRHRGPMAGAFLTMVGATISAMVIPRILGSAIDEAFESGLRSQFAVLALAILAFSALKAGFSYGQSYLSEAVSQKAAYDLRNDFFRKLQRLSFGFHDGQQTGNLMSKATADVEACRRFISMGLIRGSSTVLTLGAVTAVMMAANWRLGLVCLVFVPMLVWRSLYMSRRLRRTWMQVQMETGNMTTVLQENIAGVRLVKSFGAGGQGNRILVGISFGQRVTPHFARGRVTNPPLRRLMFQSLSRLNAIALRRRPGGAQVRGEGGLVGGADLLRRETLRVSELPDDLYIHGSDRGDPLVRWA